VITQRGCAVWWADTGQYRQAHFELLDETERARWRALKAGADRVRFGLAAVIVRLACAAELKVHPGLVPVRRLCPLCGGAHGPPRIEGTDLRLSVSHSGQRVVVATTRLGAVGVDVQATGLVDVGTASRVVLGAGERLVAADDFYVYWTRKEAVVKATGDGLNVPLRQVLVGQTGQTPRLSSYPGRPNLVAALADLDAGDGYAGAIAVLGAPGEVVVREMGAAVLLDASDVG
jgi:4'-phosphopantetheinyl transferase